MNFQKRCAIATWILGAVASRDRAAARIARPLSGFPTPKFGIPPYSDFDRPGKL